MFKDVKKLDQLGTLRPKELAIWWYQWWNGEPRHQALPDGNRQDSPSPAGVVSKIPFKTENLNDVQDTIESQLSYQEPGKYKLGQE